IVDVTTLTDGNPSNNFLTRAVTFNPAGALDGAESIAIAGRYAFVGAKAGIVVVDLDDPLHPSIAATLPSIASARAIAVPFRSAFAVDRAGLPTTGLTAAPQ